MNLEFCWCLKIISLFELSIATKHKLGIGKGNLETYWYDEYIGQNLYNILEGILHLSNQPNILTLSIEIENLLMESPDGIKNSEFLRFKPKDS